MRDDKQDAARYRWLRERLEISMEDAVDGSTRKAIHIRIGSHFIDRPAAKHRRRDHPNWHEELSRILDEEIDKAIEKEANRD